MDTSFFKDLRLQTLDCRTIEIYEKSMIRDL